MWPVIVPFINFFGYKNTFWGLRCKLLVTKMKISNYQIFKFFAKAKLNFSSQCKQGLSLKNAFVLMQMYIVQA